MPLPQADAVPAHDRTVMKWMQTGGAPFPYAADRAATVAVGHAMLGPGGVRAPQAKELETYLHGDAMRRGVHYDAVRQGYPHPKRPDGTATAVTPTYTKAIGRAYPYQVPPIQVGGNRARFDPNSGKIDVHQVRDYQLPSAVADARHEVEHARQFHPPGQSRPLPPADAAAFRTGVEVGPSLSDAMWVARDHLAQTGKPLRSPLTFPNGYRQDVGWMDRQAAAHGLYQPGGSMSPLLATPSGQAYLRMLTTPQPAPAGGGDDLINALNLTSQGR